MEVGADALLALGTATLGESGARRLARPPAPMWPGAAVAGPACPVHCTGGDNLAVHVAVAHADPGQVLVVDVHGHLDFGYWGEVLTVAAQSRGVAGLVIDGCVRDVDALEHRRFPVFARGTALPGASKQQPGRVGAPVALGEVTIGVDDWVVADRDGIVVVSAADLASVADAASARTAREQELFRALEGGATTVELLGLDDSPIER